VEANPHKPWNYKALSQNPNITWDIVEANLDRPWDYESIFERMKTTQYQLSYVLK
jgi:hypothetical protein